MGGPILELENPGAVLLLGCSERQGAGRAEGRAATPWGRELGKLVTRWGAPPCLGALQTLWEVQSVQ